MTLKTFELHKQAQSAWYCAWLRAGAVGATRVLAEDVAPLAPVVATLPANGSYAATWHTASGSVAVSCIHPEIATPMIGHCGRWHLAVELPMRCGYCHTELLVLA